MTSIDRSFALQEWQDESKSSPVFALMRRWPTTRLRI
jgi:hypothetical protein